MDDRFLHQLRREPPSGFATRLKRQLDHAQAPPRTRSYVFLGLAIFGTAFAITSPVIRHTITAWFTTPMTAPRAPEVPDKDGAAAAAPRIAASGPPGASGSVRLSQPRPVYLPPVMPRDFPPSPAATVPVAAETEPAAMVPSPPVIVAGPAVIPSSQQSALTAALTRQALFRVMTWVIQPLGLMQQGKLTFDEQRVAENAQRLQQLATMIPEVFRADTRAFEVGTTALPGIWTPANDFAAKARDLITAADALAETNPTQDREATGRAIVRVYVACQACHSRYVQP